MFHMQSWVHLDVHYSSDASCLCRKEIMQILHFRGLKELADAKAGDLLLILKWLYPPMLVIVLTRSVRTSSDYKTQ